MKEPNPFQMDCFFLLENEPTIGSRMEIEVTLPQELAGAAVRKVQCQGRVVAVEKEKTNGRTGVLCAVENYRLLEAATDQGTAT